MKNQKLIEFKQVTKKEAEQLGYKGFNNCNHYIADMSHLESGSSDSMNTISIKLPNGNDLTLCVIQASSTMSNVDVKFHLNKDDSSQYVKSMKFENGTNEPLFAVYVDQYR